jgi:TPR repeat protein
MGRFNEKNDYVQRVLSPALERFARGGELPDVFERYDLPLNLEDAQTIEASIHDARCLWTKTKTNAKFKELLPKLLQEEGHARRVLLDPTARSQERKRVETERRTRREARFARLEAAIEQVSAPGYITLRIRAELLARFKREGFSEGEISERIRVPVREQAPAPSADDNGSGLPEVTRRQIRNSLAVLGHKDLYDFLGLAGPAPKAEIARHYQLHASEWGAKPANAGKTAAQQLLGAVKAHLVEGDPAKYEVARAYDRLDDGLRPSIEVAAAEGRIPFIIFESLKAAAGKLGVEEQTAVAYIRRVAGSCKATVESEDPVPTVPCARCHARVPRLRPGEPQYCAQCKEAILQEENDAAERSRREQPAATRRQQETATKWEGEEPAGPAEQERAEEWGMLRRFVLASFLIGGCILAVVVILLTVAGHQETAKADNPSARQKLSTAPTGAADAMYNLGLRYNRAHDYAKAQEWYQKAAEAGSQAATGALSRLPLDTIAAKHPSATGSSTVETMREYGWEYEHRTPPDYAQARWWYQKAADAGGIDCMVNLGWLYQNGWGAVQDYAQAREWYQKAANAGDPAAQEALLRLPSMSSPIPASSPSPVSQASPSPSPSSTEWLAEATRYLGAENYVKALPLLKEAAKANSLEAMNQLGDLYYYGCGVVQNYGRAYNWYRKAADAGSAHAMANLGWLCENGWGAVQDYAQAREWYQKAADAGDAEAKAALSRLPSTSSPIAVSSPSPSVSQALQSPALSGADRFAEDKRYGGERYPQTRQRVLTIEDMNGLSASQVRYAINEIYARRGATFPKDREIQKQFEKFDWYHPNPNLSFDEVDQLMSDIERENVKMLAQHRADISRSQAPSVELRVVPEAPTPEKRNRRYVIDFTDPTYGHGALEIDAPDMESAMNRFHQQYPRTQVNRVLVHKSLAE